MVDYGYPKPTTPRPKTPRAPGTREQGGSVYFLISYKRRLLVAGALNRDELDVFGPVLVGARGNEAIAKKIRLMKNDRQVSDIKVFNLGEPYEPPGGF